MSRRWNGSSVMAEFEKIAADRGLISSDLAPSDEKDVVGNPHKDNPEWTRHKETEDYDITGGTGAGIIEKAHPSPVTVADAMGEGALVENQVEQHRKHVDVATREMPHGTLVGIHASLASELLKLAASLDAAGDEKAARKIDESVGRMLSVPFGKAAAFDKNAFLGLSAAAVAAIKWIAIGLGAAGAAQLPRHTAGINIANMLYAAAGRPLPRASPLRSADYPVSSSNYVRHFWLRWFTHGWTHSR